MFYNLYSKKEMWLSGIEVGHYTFMKLLIWDIWLKLTDFFRFDETNIALLTSYNK